MSTTKAIALVDNKIDYMPQRRQIVKSLDNQIDVEDVGRRKYAITSFHHLNRLLISVNVTTHRTVSLQRYQGNSHCIMIMTIKLRSSI
jgi:hypothetical protein